MKLRETYTVPKDMQDYFDKSFEDQAREPKVWFGNAKMNEEVGKLLLNKYNSSHKRNRLRDKDIFRISAPKRRINPYHLTLYRYVTMFYGLAVECYLKGYLVLAGIIDPIKKSAGKTLSLSKEITSHELGPLFEKVFNETPPANLELLTLAIKNGKYYMMKNPPTRLYGITFEQNIRYSKRLIKKIEKQVEKFKQ